MELYTVYIQKRMYENKVRYTCLIPCEIVSYLVLLYICYFICQLPTNTLTQTQLLFFPHGITCDL